MERRDAYPTDTQHIVNLSGYVWSAQQLAGLGHMRVLDVACGTGYGSDYMAGHARIVVGIDRVPEEVAVCQAKYRWILVLLSFLSFYALIARGNSMAPRAVTQMRKQSECLVGNHVSRSPRHRP